MIELHGQQRPAVLIDGDGRLTRRRRDRRAGDALRRGEGRRDRRGHRAGLLIGPVLQGRAQQATVLHREIERNQVVALGRDIGALARDVGAELAQQPVDQHDRLVHFVFQDLELAVVFVDRTRDAVSGADALEQEGRLRGGVRHRGAQRIHLAEIGIQLLELALRLVPGIDQFGIARGGADL